MKFWGSPRTVGFDWMGFTHRVIDRPERIWAAVPDDTNVLVTHGPPLGILDRGRNGQPLGDMALMKRIEVVRSACILFGHVHEQNGEVERDGIRYVNAAIGDGDQYPNLSARIHVVDL